MNQYDLVASPMKEIFIDNPPAENFKPWTHVANGIVLTTGVSQTPTQTAIPVQGDPSVLGPKRREPFRHGAAGRLDEEEGELFAGKYHIPDSEDPNTVNHMLWYEATGFKLPYPGESKVRPASDFKNQAPATTEEDDD